MQFRRFLLSAAIAPAVSAALAAAAAAQPVKSGDGLDSLSDDALLAELAGRNLTTLLDRAFEVNNVPKDKQEGMRSLIALKRLSDRKLSASQRQQLAQTVAKGIKAALPTINDPKLLMQYAAELLPAIERDINTLEYWGENPTTMANLQPVVRTVMDLLERTEQQANAAAEQLANQITNPNNAQAIKRWEEMDTLAATAAYTRANTAYYLALSLDSSSAERKEVAGKAIEHLKQFDVDDNPDRNFVRTRIAKLSLAAGDFATARKYFDQVINEPQGNANLQYDARYFKAVAEMLDKKLDAARKQLDELIAWQRANLPQDKNVQDGVSSAAAMLRFRIHDAEAKAATSDAARKQANDAAVAVLSELVKEQPALQGVVFEQLIGRLPENAPMSNLDTLLLRAMVGKGEQILLQPGDLSPEDRKVLERAVPAAAELVSRKGQPNVDATLVENASLLKAFFLQKLERLVESGNAFVDFVQAYAGSRDKAKLALDNAQFVIGQLMKDRREEEEVKKLYERFLPVAIDPPHNRHELAFEYAWRLQRQDKPQEAIRYFRLVPASDKRSLLAKYYLTIALSQQLETMGTNAPHKSSLLGEFAKLADEVNAAAAQALQTASNEHDRATARTMLIGTKLLAADLARTQQNDPERALKLLEGFEQFVKGAPNEEQRLTDMLSIRVQSLIAAGRFDQATDTLVQLLSREPQRGAQMVYDLLEKLNTQLSRAEAANDQAAVATIAKNRADLTGFLVKMARESKSEAIQKLAYGYAVFDAEVQRFAAVQESDASAKQQRLNRAKELFERLESPQGYAEYKASLPPNKPAAPYDPAVALGLARVQFDLGQYDDARKRFQKLLNDKALGPAEKVVTEHGEEKVVDNDQYWEAIYKLLRSNVAANVGLQDTTNYLKQLYVRWGERTGGRKWADEMEALRKEIAPEFDWRNPSGQPGTQPAGVAGGQ